ncbi:MAG: hypothetical protein JRI25_09820 [Deltaproteobacteria bacterium]|nr:hypothetical protein [Deltaproteobacteria bacterium]
MTGRGCWIAAAALGLLTAAPARAEEFRTFTLSDGRVFVAEVLATEGTGMRVRVPQGETFVPFGELVDMVPAEAGQLAQQDDWYLYLASDATYRAGFATSYQSVPGLHLVEGGDPVLSAEEWRAAIACDTDLDCVVEALRGNAHWMWVVAARMDGSMAVFEGAVTTGKTRTTASAPRVDPEAVNQAALEAVHLTWRPVESTETVVDTTPAPTPKPPREPRVRTPMTRDRLVALSFVPLPGYTSLAQGDSKGFGLAMATVVPATVLWVGATGKNAQSVGGHVALGVAGFYAATVVANQAFGMRSFHHGGGGDVVVGVSPTEEGGAGVQITLVR